MSAVYRCSKCYGPANCRFCGYSSVEVTNPCLDTPPPPPASPGGGGEAVMLVSKCERLKRRLAVWSRVDDERRRQLARWGDKAICGPLPAECKLAILTEELGEVARALLYGEPVQRLREELVQVAACAVGWLEAMEVEESKC